MPRSKPDYASPTLTTMDTESPVFSFSTWRCWAVGDMVFIERGECRGHSEHASLEHIDFVESLNDSGAAKAKRLYAAKKRAWSAPAGSR